MLLWRKLPLIALASALGMLGFGTDAGEAKEVPVVVEAPAGGCSTCLNSGWTHKFLNNCCNPDGDTCFSCPFCHLYTDGFTCWFAGHTLCELETDDADSTVTAESR
jgi:hypothetical protein